MKPQNKMKLTLVVIKEQSTGNIYEDIKYAQTFFPEYPKKNPKPILISDPTSAEVKQYAIALEKWEGEEEQYKKDMDSYRKQFQSVETTITDYMKEMSGFNKIPDKSKEKVWSKAWEDGHAHGYYEVYGHLVSLIELFN